VRRITHAAAKEAMLSKGFLSTPPPSVVINQINDFGVSYKVQYWISFWKDLSPSKSRDIMLTAILNHLRRAGITPAYPKQDVYYDKMPTRQLNSALVSDRKELLRQVELFESLNEAELEDLAEAMHQIFYKEGEAIITADSEGSSMFVLLEGLCDVHIENNEIGQLVKVAQLNPGQFFGEMSLLTGEARSATVMAATDSLVYEIKKEHLAGLFDKRPEIIMMIGQTLADRRIHNQKLTQNLSEKELLVQSEKTRQQLVSKIKSFFWNVK
jgi:CRP-like cAMP-binding protein